MANKIISNKPYSMNAYLEKLSKNSFLITVLSKREVKIKYSRTFLGLGWVIIQPIIVVAIYTLFFRDFIKLDTGSIPYPSFVLTGLVLWYLFTGLISKCTYALLESTDLINKVSFPRIIILISKSIPIIIECLILLILACLMVAFSPQKLGINALSVLFYFFQTAILSFAFGLLFSIMVLNKRDLAHAIPFLINFGIWLTPVFYSVSIIPEEYKQLFRYGNPLTLSIEGLRGALFYNQGISGASWILFIGSCFLLLVSFIIFVKFEKRIVESL